MISDKMTEIFDNISYASTNKKKCLSKYKIIIMNW